MTKRTFTSRFKSLNLYQRITAVSSALIVLSVFLPWYKDLDSRQIGDVFLGITGPLTLVGVIILVMAGFSLILDALQMYKRKMPQLPMKESWLKMAMGLEALFLLLITNSVYFHPKFGINITHKEVGIGMIFVFLGMIGLTLGGYFQSKYEEADATRQETMEAKEPEPLATMPELSESDISESTPQPAGLESQEQKEEEPAPPQTLRMDL